MFRQCDRLVIKRMSFEWKIENFIVRERILSTKIFFFSGTKFTIRIYTKYQFIDNAELVAIFLLKEHSRTERRFESSLGLKSADGSNLVPHYYNSSCEDADYSCIALFDRSKLTSAKEHVLGPFGTLTVFCEIREVDYSSVEAETQTSLTDSFKTLSNDLEEYYLSGSDTDVVLDVRGEKFSAHRFVLASRSSVFRSMFEADMKEKETGDVNITDCDPDSFRAFLLFLYSGKLTVITSDNALGLYTIADKYNVQELKKECCECLARELSIHSVCDVLHLATLHEEQRLLKSATNYFIINASRILRTRRWQTLLEVNPTLANGLFIEMADALTLPK